MFKAAHRGFQLAEGGGGEFTLIYMPRTILISTSKLMDQ